MNVKRGIALIITNNEYQNCNKLPSCKKDGEDMKSVLLTLGFDIIYIEDASRQKTFDEINTFLDAANLYSTVLLYYSGHGIQIDGENYIVPIDCNPVDNKSILINTGLIPISIITDYMASNPRKTNIIILDACRNAPTFSKNIMQGGLAEIKSGQGTFVSFATAPNKVAIGSNSAKENSVFTKCLLDHIQKPNIKIEDLFKLVRRDVLKETSKIQNPWESTSLTEDFYFNVMSSDEIAEDIYKSIRNNFEAIEFIRLSQYYSYTISDIYRIYSKQKSEKPGGIYFENVNEFELFILQQLLELGFEYKFYRWMYKENPVIMGEILHNPDSISLEPLPDNSIEVWIEATLVKADEPGYIVSGNTNLPKGTKLQISLKNDKSAYSAQSKAIVNDGIFESACFTVNGNELSSGVYGIKITMPIASVQDKAVKEIIGDKARNLVGTLVTCDIIYGKSIEFTQIIRL